MLRFTFVIARYGADILGGAEKHARDVAEHLAERGHHVRVHTTCATSYATWRNALPAGTSELRGVQVHRHPTTMGRLRPLDTLAKAAAGALTGVEWLARTWAVAQGPTCSGLLDAVASESDERDLIVFFSLLSQLTFAGLPRAARRAVLVPLVHEEAPIYTSLARDTLRKPRALLVNTEEEAARIMRVAGPGLPPVAIVAVGGEDPLPAPRGFAPRITGPYVLILGRHAKTKPMLPLWRRLTSDPSLPSLQVGSENVPWRDVQLVTVGELSPLYAAVPNVLPLGFVDDAERWELVRHAVALINPSIYESLSLVLLEAWACKVPVIVNQCCDVTAGQCARSGGGLPIDFIDASRGARQMADGLASSQHRQQMGVKGNAYWHQRYRWNRVVETYERAAEAVRDGSDMTQALGDCVWDLPAGPDNP